MKHFVLLMLGTAAFAAIGFAAEVGLLPGAWEKWAPWAMIAFGVALLLLVWCNRGSLMAWVFGKDDDKIK